MKKRLWLIIPLLAIAALVAVLVYVTRGHSISVLDPAGTIGREQRELMYIATFFMALVIVPVYIMAFVIAWRYHEDNPKKRPHKPNWDHDHRFEAIWWGFPLAIIMVLSVLAWQSSHSLDPYKAIHNQNERPLEVQVIALNWKWLFIYPEQNVATAGELTLPINRPIEFSITSDAPMNSFWIPRLGGQVYAMAGMKTKLHLMADKPGVYRGSSANISGSGFAKMAFDTRVVSGGEFDSWIDSAQNTSNNLTASEYQLLAMPGTLEQPITYGQVSTSLFDDVIMKYMMPMSSEGQHAH